MLERDADGHVRMAGPWVEERRIGFAVDDPGHRFAGIRLRIVDAVAAVHVTRPTGRPVPTVLTCGAAEENLANNRLLATVLRAQGYPASLREVPDAHNHVAWRDALDPHLAELLTEVWGDA